MVKSVITFEKFIKKLENEKKTFEEAYREKGEGLLFCVGSLYLVGEIKAYIGRR